MNWKTILIQGIESAIVIAVSYWIYRLLYGTLKKTARRLGRELKMPNTIRVILGLIIAVIAVMVLLQIWNIDLLPYLAAFGVTGIIIGLALQDPLANLISGFLVL
ncbi:MAG: mechanosensitive ion channel family protein, partial [Thermotogae bacterium]